MKISMDKQYRTRNDGYELRLDAVGCGGTHPVQGAVRPLGGEVWTQCVWMENGGYKLHEEHGLDLIEAPKTVEMDFWVNVYDSPQGVVDGGCTFSSKSAALESAKRNQDHFACINIKRTVEEGEGL